MFCHSDDFFFCRMPYGLRSALLFSWAIGSARAWRKATFQCLWALGVMYILVSTVGGLGELRFDWDQHRFLRCGGGACCQIQPRIGALVGDTGRWVKRCMSQALSGFHKVRNLLALPWGWLGAIPLQSTVLSWDQSIGFGVIASVWLHLCFPDADLNGLCGQEGRNI